ncbi:MAG: hypothetical protein KA715_10235 [Xanthomonadaceae bacterium]|nr:hypothetical protein [Xanthomonadaceae bacterium]
MTKHLHIIVLVLSLGLIHCGPPVDPESIDRQKMMDTLAKLDALKGTFTGEVLNQKTDEVVGVGTLSLSADSEIYNPPTQSKSLLRTVLRATLELQLPEKKLTITFNESYFDPERNLFRVGFNPMLADPRLNVQSKSSFVLTGNLSGDNIKGEVVADGYPTDGMKFNFKNTAGSTELNQALVVSPTDHSAEQLERVYVDSAKKYRFVMSGRTLSHEVDFYKMLTPFQWVEVSYFFGIDTPVLFESAKWDRRTRQLTAITKSSSMSSFAVTYYLDCIAAADVKTSGRLGLPESLECTVRSSNRGVIKTFQLQSQ